MVPYSMVSDANVFYYIYSFPRSVALMQKQFQHQLLDGDCVICYVRIIYLNAYCMNVSSITNSTALLFST